MTPTIHGRTAFGIMLGYVSGVIFRSVLDGDSASCSIDQPRSTLLAVRCVSMGLADANESEARLLLTGAQSLNWRLMLASPVSATR